MSNDNPKYYQLKIGENIVGFKRITIEYIPLSGNKWQLEPIEFTDSFYVSKPPMNIAGLPRPRLRKDSGRD